MTVTFAVEVTPIITVAFLVFIIPAVILELWGVRRKKKGDTISENVWWAQQRVPGLRFVVAAFLVWLFIHFLFDGKYM